MDSCFPAGHFSAKPYPVDTVLLAGAEPTIPPPPTATARFIGPGLLHTGRSPPLWLSRIGTERRETEARERAGVLVTLFETRDVFSQKQ